jgi:hypothetical protein
VSTPIIGREGLLRLVEQAEWLRARKLEGGGASWRARTWASSPHGGAEEVPVRELWTSFPETARNDVLGLLGMLLERWAVRAGPAAEEAGSEHRADA